MRNADEISDIVCAMMGKSRQSRRIIRSLMEHISFRRIGPQTEEQSAEIAREELGDPDHTTKAVRALLKVLLTLPPRSGSLRAGIFHL